MAELIYSGATHHLFIPDGQDRIGGGPAFRGYMGRRPVEGLSSRYFSSFNLPAVPQSEWRDRAEEMERSQTRIGDLLDRAREKGRADFDHKDQDQTNYCWVNAPVRNIEIVRIEQNLEPVILSPASAGAQIKGYRNVGGFGSEALEWIAERGVSPVDLWPANHWYDRRYDTEESRQAALKYRPTEWMVLQPNDAEQMVSAVLHRKVLSVGLMWWGHEVNIIGLAIRNGELVWEIENSWKNWGNRGRAFLPFSKGISPDAVMIGAMRPAA
jgi:hypothetical protein